MCASTSTIIPSRTPRCSASSRCWPIRTWCALSMARRCSPVIAAATTRVRRSRTPAMSRPWSSTNAPHAATAVPTTSQRRHRRARPCSCVPPSAVTIWNRHRALLRLLERYGAAELDAAICEAIERGVPHPNAVRLALDHRRELRDQPPPVVVILPEHVKVRDAHVQPHRLEPYDQLKERGDE